MFDKGAKAIQWRKDIQLVLEQLGTHTARKKEKKT
jgi:hypothetical protein